MTKREYPYIAKGRNGTTVCFYKKGEGTVIKESERSFTADLYPVGRKIHGGWGDDEDPILFTPVGITITSTVGKVASVEYPYIAEGRVNKTQILYYAQNKGVVVKEGLTPTRFPLGMLVDDWDHPYSVKPIGIVVTSTI